MLRKILNKIDTGITVSLVGVASNKHNINKKETGITNVCILKLQLLFFNCNVVFST